MDIRMLRSTTQQRDRERAERATLVEQEKLVRGGQRRTAGMEHAPGPCTMHHHACMSTCTPQAVMHPSSTALVREH